MSNQSAYNWNSTRATYFQKQALMSDLLEMGCSEGVFMAWAINTLTWRQMKEIAYHMQVAKNSQDKAYDNRTETEQVDAK